MDDPLEIPKFDLAEQIMAEQRKVAAMRRKGPGRKTNAVKREIPGPVIPVCAPEPVIVSSQAEQIIAEIVARDIRQLCGGSVCVQ
jgi:hypothetical protein